MKLCWHRMAWHFFVCECVGVDSPRLSFFKPVYFDYLLKHIWAVEEVLVVVFLIIQPSSGPRFDYPSRVSRVLVYRLPVCAVVGVFSVSAVGNVFMCDLIIHWTDSFMKGCIWNHTLWIDTSEEVITFRQLKNYVLYQWSQTQFLERHRPAKFSSNPY